MKTIIIKLCAIAIVLCLIFGLMFAFSAYMLSLAPSTTCPMFMQFVGILPWIAVLLGIGARMMAFLDDEETKRNQYTNRRRMNSGLISH